MTELNQNTIYFLRLIKQYLDSKGKDYSVPDFASEAHFSEILRIASYNRCDPFVYHTIWKWVADYGLNAEVLKQYKNKLMLDAIRRIRADAELKEVITAFNNAGIKFMLLKGVILASLYPDPVYRNTVDADIHVSDDYLERTEEILTGRGYINVPNEAVIFERAYNLDGVLKIDLHTRLFDKFYQHNRAAVVESGLESTMNRRNIRVLDVLAETLSINHFIIYLFCHHAKHFIASGINIRHLIDLCVYVNEYNEQFDWELILTALNRFGIREFALYFLYICQHYLGMVNLSFLYTDVEEDVVIMLLHDIIEKTADGDGAFQRASVRDIVQNIYTNSKQGNKHRRKTSNYFPDTKSLSLKYRYAIKYPVLLPIAWIHRACSYFWKVIRKQRVIPHAERAKIAKDRVTLLKRIGIL